MAHYSLENLSFTYPGAAAPILRDVTLTIEQGEYVVVCGQSGSGKTTLLRHLKSVLTPYGDRKGRILYDGVPLEELSQKEQATQIGFVMQNPDDQIVTDKVWHELAFGLESIGCDPKTMRLRVAEMATYFGIQSWFDRDVSQLSGGQKQLLNLAGIMAMQPQVLILDEPTSQLDPIAASDFLNTVKKINVELGTTVIITEHRLEDIYPFADRVIVMEEGSVVANDTPRNVGNRLWKSHSPMFAALPTPVRVFYDAEAEGNCPLTVREGRTFLTCAFDGRPIPYPSTEQEPPVDKVKEPVLRVKDVWFRYEKDAQDVLKGVEFAVGKGRIFAIVGANGAGKSTTMGLITGANRPYRGKVEIFGQPLHKYRAGSLWKNCVSMLPQDPKSLFVKKTVGLDLEEMCQNQETIGQIASLCQVSHLLDKHPYDLSGGELQRCALAKVLLTQPRLLLLDEPTKGMDSFFKVKFGAILKKLKDQGITIVMVSHDVEFCADYADLVGMFFDGQIVTMDTPRRFFGQNSFYTTAANRMSRCVFQNAVTAADVVALYRKNRGGQV